MTSTLSLTGAGNSGASIVSQILKLDPVVWLDAQLEANNIAQGAVTLLATDNQYNQADTAAETAYDISFAVWFKCSDNGTLIWLGDKDADDIYLTMALVAGALTATAESAADGADTATTAATTYADDAWHLGIAVFTGTSQSIYVDDVAVVTNTATNTIAGTFDRTAIGHFGGATAATPAEGEISQSAVFDVALTSAQRTSMYNSGTMIDFADVVTPTAQWFLNDSSRAKWEDRIGGLNMTAAGGTGQPELVAGLRNDGATFVAASTQRLETNTEADTAYPISVELKFKSGSSAADQTLFYLGDKDSATEFLSIRLDTAGDISVIASSAGDGEQSATLAGSFGDDAWHSVLAVWTNATTRDVSVDGSAFTQDVVSVTIGATYDRTGFGRLGDSSPTLYLDGELDEVKFWDSALTAANAATLHNSGVPLSLQQTQSLVSPPKNYWSHDTHAPYLDAIGTLDLTPFGDKLLPVSAAGPDELQAVEGSALEQWVDRGANGNTPVQATVIERPQLVRMPWANEQGYMNAVRFDGVDDVMAVTLGSSVSQPFETFSVVRFISPSSGVNEYVWADDTHPHFRKHSSNTISAHAGGSLLLGSVATDNFELFNIEVNGGSTTIIRNGVTDATGGTGTTAHTDLFLGSRNADSDDPGFFEILEHLVFPSGLLSAADKALVVTHLRNKHTLQWGDVVATGPSLWISASSTEITTANDGSGNPVANAETIGFWPDVSGNSHNVIQAVGLFRPTWDASNPSFNVKAVVSFDGVNDALSVLDPVDMDNGVGLTIGFVANLTAASADHYLIEKAGTYSLWIDSDGEVHFAIGTDGDAYATVIADLDADITAGTPFIVVIQYVTTAIKLYINGVQKGSTVTTVNGDVLDTTADVIIGASSAAGADGWAGEIADAIVFNRGISDDEINAHFRPIASFYSTPWTDI